MSILNSLSNILFHDLVCSYVGRVMDWTCPPSLKLDLSIKKLDLESNHYKLSLEVLRNKLCGLGPGKLMHIWHFIRNREISRATLMGSLEAFDVSNRKVLRAKLDAYGFTKQSQALRKYLTKR